MFPKATGAGTAYRSPAQTKQAFGGSNQAAVSRRAIATMERTARRAPEVVVRITGRQHGGSHVLANFAYICRLGHGPEKELGLHTSEGEVIHDGQEMQKLAQEWHEYEMGDDSRRKGATSLSMILSMPTGSDPEKVQAAALDFARTEFANRSWVASLHVDRDHPHVHLTVARRDHDGRRFHPNRDDLFRYRQRFAEKLRNRGIEANATPAKARGIDPKHEHIAARKIRENGVVPRLDRVRAARGGRFETAAREDPVDIILASQRAIVRAAYERLIAELAASPSLVNKTVAQSLQRFVDALPEPQPNSRKAARRIAEARETSGRAVAAPDLLAAATMKLREATERSRRSVGLSEERGGYSDDAHRAHRSDALEPTASPTDASERQASIEPQHAITAILREVQERNRILRDREHDRSPDRDGSRR